MCFIAQWTSLLGYEIHGFLTLSSPSGFTVLGNQAEKGTTPKQAKLMQNMLIKMSSPHIIQV